MVPVVLIGGGGHAKVVAAVVRKIPGFEIVGYTAITDGSAMLNLPYLGSDDALLRLVTKKRVAAAVVGIGIVDINEKRRSLHQMLVDCCLTLPPIVSPTAIVNEQVAIGAGAVVMDGAVINPGTTIGELCIVNTNATVEHDCDVGAYSHVAPGAVLCGGVAIGNRCVIGAGACVLQGVHIGEGCFVGAGSTVTCDLVDPGVYVGSPARRISR